MEWYLKVVRDNYANFSGRARRKEFWMFVLFNIVISWGLNFIDNMLGFTYQTATWPIPGYEEWSSYYSQSGYLSSIYSLVVFIPSLAVSVRRLHDIGKSGFNLLWSFVCCIGFLYLLYLFVTEGERGTNQYGPDPKEEDFFDQNHPDNSFKREF